MVGKSESKKGTKTGAKTGIEKCVELVSGGLEGKRVIVRRPPTQPGKEGETYEGVFVRWASGYNTVHLMVPSGTPDQSDIPMPTIAPVDDAFVMKGDGSMQVESVRSLTFRS